MSIRTRLLVAYTAILLVGFAALAIVTGDQIQAAARGDYEQRLINEVRLVAQGIQSFARDSQGNITAENFESLISDYESEIDGQIVLYVVDDIRSLTPHWEDELPELETALRGETIVTQRPNDDGTPSLYTASLVSRREMRMSSIVVQLSVPISNLDRLVWQRWGVLWMVFALVTLLAVMAALVVGRSIIRPLYALRESALQLSKGDFSHRVTSIGRDEIGEVAHAFNEMAHQVESMLEEQRAFASNTSHELRTPLTTIRLRSEALRYEDLDDTITHQYISEIDDEVRRLSALIEDLTLLSRLDAGRAELGNNEIDMRRFMSSLKQIMRPQASRKNIEITLEMTEDIVPVYASLNHLTVVFRNVLDNAIKYTPEGGHITCRMMTDSIGVHWEIIDDGQGIDADQIPHLFERFYRADKARSRDIPGTGLGLALVKSIVNAYNGQISIHSEGANKGTTIRIFLPYQR